MRAAAMILVPGMLAAMALPAGAQVLYHCNFSRECSGTDRPCANIEVTDISGLALERRGAEWHLWGSGEVDIVLQPVPGGNDDLRSWVSPAVDPDTQAIAMLSIARDGRALLSRHESFPAPQARLELGTCRRKDAP